MFERIRYPDGQISAIWNKDIVTSDEFLIKERINSYEDLFYIEAIADTIDNNILKTGGTTKYTLFIPCMFGQRSDRRFESFQSFDLKLITDIINKCNFGKVQVFDPHSDVSLALINRSEKVSSFDHVKKAVDDIRQFKMNWPQEDLILVSPDAGAYKKVFEYGEKLNLPVMGAMKHRDKTGKVDLLFSQDVTGKDCLIVDDLCDGGYTFELLGKALKDHGARKVYLYVSHGLFSKGYAKLYEVIDHIYCTNSVKDVDKSFGLPRTSDDLSKFEIVSDYITQYKII